ncbi:PPE domain-containing protein [Gordonia sp. OPL2]|uniref:PPE domain-containing protein n=1 Tax=Gordonia sp. OPL2 TaxID=2486274 RepID=UPI001655ED40|nr:PPE domain-containing protein [Gordonia sp. OPL2]ROZ83455.1 PPE domain-containing protein [Gordonia sp. OPL2]
MAGFTGVVWDARSTERLSTELGDGAGAGPLTQAGVSWAHLASEMSSAAVEYSSILVALGVHWDSSHTSATFEKLTRLAGWFAEAAAVAGRNAVRAESQAAAVTVARLTMPNLAEVDIAEKAMQTATTLGAIAPALVGAAAHAERALHDQRMRAARVMDTYESATEPAARPWKDGAAAPNLVSAAPLGAERAARETAARVAASRPTPQNPAGPAPIPVGGLSLGVTAAPEKTRYAPTIVASGSPQSSASAPVAPAGAGAATPSGPMAPIAPHGAAAADRVVARGAVADDATEETAAGAAAADDGSPATWADLATADTSVVQHVSGNSASRSLDPRYLDETLSLGSGKGA